MEERQIKKVVQGTAKVRKKSGIHSLTDSLISDDAGNVKSYLRDDVLIPGIKKILYTIISESAHMIFLGGVGSTKAGGSKISYRDFYDQKTVSRRPETTRNRFDHDDILFESRGEAEAVLDEMIEVIGKYGFVTVADMYDMAQLSQPYTSNRYGWTNLSSAEVKRAIGGGYILDLPKAKPIER